MSQSSVAVRDDQGRWFLINASPDFSTQIQPFPDLQPAAGAPRGTPFSAVFLTNADLDHVLGLWSMREGKPLHVVAPAAVWETVDAHLGLTAVMSSFCGICRHEPTTDQWTPPPGSCGTAGSLSYRAIPLPGGPPCYSKTRDLAGGQSVAYDFTDRRTGGRLLVAPEVGGVTDALVQAMREADGVLFDGTFWSGDELGGVRPGARTAADMGHLTMKDQSLPLLAGLGAAHKVYIHVNNTNPALFPGSPERVAVEAAGVKIGFDGLEFEL